MRPNRALMRFLIGWILISTGLSACQPSFRSAQKYRIAHAAEPRRAWTYDDLRAFDPPDAPDSDLDVTAIYLRQRDQQLQVRLEFIDLPIQPEVTLFIAVNTRTGGASALPGMEAETGFEWDYLLEIPQSGHPASYSHALEPVKDVRLSVYRNLQLDTLTINLWQPALPGTGGCADCRVALQVFVRRDSTNTIADSTEVVRSTGEPPPQVPLLMAFWNTFPAYTPAQTLRRWDGAHTGPGGERHGLSRLLHAALRTGTAVMLLDLASPEWLSAVDYLDGTNLLRKLQDKDLLILPDTMPILPLESDTGRQMALAAPYFASASRSAVTAFGLKPAPVLFTWQPEALGEMLRQNYSLIVTIGNEAESPVMLPKLNSARRTGSLLLSIPTPSFNQAGVLGPNTELLAQLCHQAWTSWTGSPEEVLVLGGNLPVSTWGDPESAAATLEYLHSRPWLKFLHLPDLLILGEHGSIEWKMAAPAQLTNPQEAYLREPDHPDGAIAGAYLASLRSIHTPTGFQADEVRRLRAVRELAYFSALLEWASAPAPVSGCNVDFNSDGYKDCLLASDKFFVVVDPIGARLVALFSVQNSGYAQIIGPFSQVTTELSFPAAWQKGDVSGLYGPNQGSETSPEIFTPQIEGAQLTLSASSFRVFELLPTGLKVSYRFHVEPQTPYQTVFSLLVAPETRFTPDWRERYYKTADGNQVMWGVRGAIGVKLFGSASITLTSFLDSSAYQGKLEDPDFEYPLGHFTPFPFALVDIRAQDDFFIQFQIIQPES